MAFSKLSVATMGTGAAGVGSVGIVGWQLLSSGIFSSTPNYSLNDISLKDDPREITFNEYGCFNKMFPGVSIGKNETESITSFNFTSPSAHDQENNPIGCAVMKMSHDLDRLKWILSGEIVLKGDNVAWVVWVEGFGKLEANASQSTDFQQSLEYRLALLEKAGNEGNWDVKTGYSWQDQGISVASYAYDLKIYVSVPDDQEWVKVNKENSTLQDFVEKMTTTPQNPSNHEYSGIWEYTGEGGDKEPFQEIKISAEPGKEEFLGKVVDPTVRWREDCTHSCKIYFPVDQKWKSYAKGNELDLSGNLSSWYQPFKNKKGKWKTLSDYCSETNKSEQLGNVCDVVN